MYTPDSQGFLAEDGALTAAASHGMPRQVSTLDAIQRALTARQVPGAAFANVDGSRAATAAHQNNIQDGSKRLASAMDWLRDLIGGVKESNSGYQQLDRDKAGKINDQTRKVRTAQSGRTSSNGWPVNPSRSSRTVPGTNVRLNVADGPAGDVLMHVAAQVHNRVENIELTQPGTGAEDDWGWAERNIAGSKTISNHASATAIDLNAGRHPDGAGDTFTPAQVGEIHTILDEVDGVVRWGGDYTSRTPDEMHFEINASPAEVERVAERLREAAGQR